MEAYNIIWASGVTIFSIILGISIIIFGTPEFLLLEAETNFVASHIVSSIEKFGSFLVGLVVIVSGMILAVFCLMSRNDSVG